jgi:hypothetical protein
MRYFSWLGRCSPDIMLVINSLTRLDRTWLVLLLEGQPPMSNCFNVAQTQNNSRHRLEGPNPYLPSSTPLTSFPPCPGNPAGGLDLTWKVWKE